MASPHLTTGSAVSESNTDSRPESWRAHRTATGGDFCAVPVVGDYNSHNRHNHANRDASGDGCRMGQRPFKLRLLCVAARILRRLADVRLDLHGLGLGEAGYDEPSLMLMVVVTLW